MNMGRLRPQIMEAIVFGPFGMWIGMRMEATEVVTIVLANLSAPLEP